MPQGETLRVNGLRELLRGIAQADRNTKREVRGALREVGDIVRRDAVSFFSPVSPRSAAGYRTRVRQRGVAVEQSLRKTTGLHSEWGAYQMRHALLPALMVNEKKTEQAMEQALGKVARIFNSGGVV